MAKIKYGVYLENPNHCYIISNAGLEWAEDTVPGSFTNPPIKMTVLETEHGSDMNDIFSAVDNDQNHPELIDHLMQALRGELPGWALTGVNISADGIYLIYRTKHEPMLLDCGLLCGDGQILVDGDFKLLFKVDHADGMPAERYEVEHREAHLSELEPHKVPNPRATKCDSCKIHIVRITEFIGPRKYRSLELRSDGHDQPYIPGKQYCLITEY